MSFSDKLRQLRKERGITQIVLAKSIGVTDRNLRRYEKNEIEPPLSVITAIADYFQISVDFLLGRSDTREQLSSEADDPQPIKNDAQ